MKKLYTTFYYAYKDAPNYSKVHALFQSALSTENETIAEVAQASIMLVAEYLNLNVRFKIASEEYANQSLGRADRLIDIIQKEGFTNYIGAIGGKKIYKRSYFRGYGIKLQFLNPYLGSYKQPTKKFVEGLSILDLLMFESKANAREILNSYTLGK
jgi:hypothetical protein